MEAFDLVKKNVEFPNWWRSGDTLRCIYAAKFDPKKAFEVRNSKKKGSNSFLARKGQYYTY
jgi:hypothetical protein